MKPSLKHESNSQTSSLNFYICCRHIIIVHQEENLRREPFLHTATPFPLPVLRCEFGKLSTCRDRVSTTQDNIERAGVICLRVETLECVVLAMFILVLTFVTVEVVDLSEFTPLPLREACFVSYDVLKGHSRQWLVAGMLLELELTDNLADFAKRPK